MSSLPDRRASIEGITFEGTRLRLSYTIARKLYRCPGCGASIPIGSSHTLVQHLSAEPPFHQHWHRACAARDLIRELKSTRVVQAS